MHKRSIGFAEFSLFIITIIWGLGFPITQLAIDKGFQANTIMVGRFLIATIVLGLVYYKRLKNLDKNIIKYGVITGLFLFAGFYFQTLGNVFTTSSKNGFITQLNIVFVPFIFFFFFRKRVDIFNIVSVIIAVIGMFLLSYTNEGFSGINIGDFYTLICAVMVAFHVVTGSYYQKKYDFDPASFVFVNIVTSCILSVIAMILFDTIPSVSIISYWPLLFLGLFNTALGFLVQSYALKISLPTRVSLIVALESVFAVIGAVLIENEIITPMVIIGGLLIISGVLISELDPLRKNEKSRKKIIT